MPVRRGSDQAAPEDDADHDAPPDAVPEEEDHFSDAALTKVITDYMPLVRHVVNRIAVGSMNGGILQYEDMVSYGVQGLIEAYYAYDPDKGAKFSTYALPRIRGSILDAIRAAHPLPRSLQKFGSDLEKATSALHATLNRAPTRDELAEYMGLASVDFLSSLRTSNVRVVSLDSLAESSSNGGGSEKLWEMADEDPNIDPDSVAEETMVRARLAVAIELLPEREKTIVRLYYMKSQSLKSIGAALGISESRASQLRHRAIRRLRTVLTQELEDAA
ncbi:MAG: FliA/WhiG family RNA polymerase sigma factor [Chloroflexota bacterium]|nr:FliA/WhiG family RNA polymerase sigma factor [Chloroflexota bacterium]